MAVKKIRVLFQVNELSFSGTTKAILSFCRFIDREKFEPFLFYKGFEKNLRYYRHKMSAAFSAKARFRFEELYLISQARRPDFEKIIGADHMKSGDWNEFKQFVNRIQPDLIHFSRGDEVDWYTENIQELPSSIALLETSIFGKSSSKTYVDRLSRIFLITDWLKSRCPWVGAKGRNLFMPIMVAAHPFNLRKKLGILESELIVGRISRPGLDNGDDVLNIYQKIKTPCHLLVLGGGPALLEAAKKDSRILCLPPTTNDVEMSEFYNSVDVLLHYRREGETFGMSIADAMIHGKPVVSHRSFMDNAQEELLAIHSEQPCGFVVEENDFLNHAEKINLLLTDAKLRSQMGQNGKARAYQLFDAVSVTRKLESEYLQVISPA